MNRTALAAAALLGAATLAGCGGSAESDAAAQGTTDLAATSKSSLGVSPGLAAATADVRRVAPKLEQYYFAKGYPNDLKGAKASMKKARLTLTQGNKLGGYTFDKQAEEFVLCVQNTSGAWATYDTAPMATGATGEAGGCPKNAGTGTGVVGPEHPGH